MVLDIKTVQLAAVSPAIVLKITDNDALRSQLSALQRAGRAGPLYCVNGRERVAADFS